MAYPHPSLQPVLDSTYGVVLYQEQVMQIAQVLAGFSLGQADLLRRAMGKKKAEEMAKVREQFLQGTGKHGVEAKLANEIFDLMEKFAGYAFIKFIPRPMHLSCAHGGSSSLSCSVHGGKPVCGYAKH